MRAWPALCALIALASALAWNQAAPPLLAWQAELWAARPWTLWTASWIHLSPGHWLANLLALAAVAQLGWALRAGRAEALALLLAWPLGTLALRLWPQVLSYGGLSGLVHAAVAVLGVHALRGAGSPALALGLLGGLALKLALEQGWSHPIGFDSEWGFNIVYAAHLSGAVAGLLTALLVGQLPGLRHAGRPAPKDEHGGAE